MDDAAVDAAWDELPHKNGMVEPVRTKHHIIKADLRRAIAAACESKADSLSAPLPGNAYPLEWQEIVQGFLREWAREMKATNPSS